MRTVTPRLGLDRDGRRMFAAMLALQGAFGSYQTLWPLYIAALGASPSQVGLVIGLTGVLRLVLLLPSGMLADRAPAKWIIVGGQGVMVLALLAYAGARSWWQLLPAGVLYAVGTAVFPAILATVAAIAGHGSQRLRTFTLINTVAPSIGLLAAPLIGGLIAAWVALRAVFLFAALLTALAVALFARVSGTTEPAPSAAAASYRSTFAQPAIRRLCLLEMAAIFCITLGMAFVPNYLHAIHGVSDGTIGAFGSLSAVGSIALGLLVHRVAVLRRPLRGIALALACVAAGLGLALLGARLPFFGAAYVLFGGFFATWTLFEAALSGVTPAEYRARTYAIAELLSGAGYALAPVLAGVLYERDPRLPLAFSALLILALLATMGIMMQRTSLEETDPAREAR